MKCMNTNFIILLQLTYYSSISIGFSAVHSGSLRRPKFMAYNLSMYVVEDTLIGITASYICVYD